MDLTALEKYNYKNYIQQMNYHHYFNQIQLSSVNAVHDNDEEEIDDDSIINELDHFYSQDQQPPLINKIQSFVYAQQAKDSIIQSPKRHCQQFNGRFENKLEKYGKGSKEDRIQDKKNYIQNQKYSPSQKISPICKKSIKEQLMEQNKLLEQKLNSNRQAHRIFEFQRQGQQNNRVVSNQLNKKQQATSINNAGIVHQNRSKMEDQYANSSTIKFYNFIMKELPRCHHCHSALTFIVEYENSCKLECKRCESQIQGRSYSPVIGVLYDLQTKLRFEQQVQLSQSILDALDRQLQRLKKQIEKIEGIKDKMARIRNISRKKYKEISEAKYFIKKNLSKLNTDDFLELTSKIPREYLQQMQRWRQIDYAYEEKWRDIYALIYRMMPICLHDHSESKILSGLHKILNYQKNQQMKLSVSQNIRFPIKQMESVVFMVDGTYNLPVFENIKHLQMQFQHKKTQRELNLLFGNLPRQIYSLGFTFNHKLNSHISAQNFPFLKFIAPVASIKKLDITIDNVKQFADILRLPELVTEKLEFRLKITKHLFSRQELNLPQHYFLKLLENLGPNLVKFQFSIPESIDVFGKVNYEKLLEKKKLCVFSLERGQKQPSKHRNIRILQGLNQQIAAAEKKKEQITKKLLLQRIKFVKFLKSANSQKLNQNKIILNSIITFL